MKYTENQFDSLDKELKKYDSERKKKAKRRKNDMKKAIRKKEIASEIYSDGKEHPYYDNLHQYSKNKIHCSCGMCKEKTNYRKNRLGYEYGPTVSDRKKMDSMESDLADYYNGHYDLEEN